MNNVPSRRLTSEGPLTRKKLEALNTSLSDLATLLGQGEYAAAVEQANQVLRGPMSLLLRRKYRQAWRSDGRVYTAYFYGPVLDDKQWAALIAVATGLLRFVEDSNNQLRRRTYANELLSVCAEYLGIVGTDLGQQIATEPLKKPIPPEQRTKPLTLKCAAQLMNWQGKRPDKALRRAIDEGTLAYIKLSRQRFIFNKQDFPPAAHSHI